jgi:hypothetical protein
MDAVTVTQQASRALHVADAVSSTFVGATLDGTTFSTPAALVVVRRQQLHLMGTGRRTCMSTCTHIRFTAAPHYT